MKGCTFVTCVLTGGAVLILFSALATSTPITSTTSTQRTTRTDVTTKSPVTPSSKPGAHVTGKEVKSDHADSLESVSGTSNVQEKSNERESGNISKTGNSDPRRTEATTGNDPKVSVSNTGKEDPKRHDSEKGLEGTSGRVTPITNQGYPEGPCTPGDRTSYICNACYCDESGKGFICTKASCPFLPGRCVPGSSWTKNCNTCNCSALGFPSCTEKQCVSQDSNKPAENMPQRKPSN